MSNRCCGHRDTVAGRADLWREQTRDCTSCGKTHWLDPDGLFTVDPRQLICDPCAMKPYHIERNRQARAEAGRRGQEACAAARVARAARAEAARLAAEETPAEREARRAKVWGAAYAQPEADLESIDEDAPWDEDDEG